MRQMRTDVGAINPARVRGWLGQPAVLLALVGALIVLAVGRLVPLPPIVTGEEQVRRELVATRGKVVEQRYLYLTAQREFELYLSKHDLSNLPQQMHDIAAQMRAGGDKPTLLAAAHDRATRAADFGRALARYGKPADTLYTLLRAYDDELMSYSRTLGARSEDLRRSTWPILSWLQRYPRPAGEATDIRFFPGEAVERNVATLEAAVAEIDNAPDTADAIERAATAADPIWDAGLMVPTVAWVHDGYFGALRHYDAQMLQAAAAPDPPMALTRALVAGLGSVLLLALMLGGLVLLFAPTRGGRGAVRPASPQMSFADE